MEIGSVQLVDIEREVREAYLDYAMSVITSRALPDVRDGLKPVQRRILYTMFDSGLRPDRAYKKSAATVGDVLGKYHPHGDSAVYDAMVRLAQDFSMRYPLVDGQGNFGCFTGDTKIKLLDGTERTFAELAELPPDTVFHVYSVDASGRIVVGDGRHSRITRRNAEVIELTLDDGSKVKCTPDHRFMLRDGSWREAQSLTIEDSLMAGYFDTAPINERTNDYLRVLQPATGQYEEILAVAATHNHRVVGIRWLADPVDVYDITVDEHHNFMLANGCVVHNSIDGDPAAAHRYTEARPAPLAMEMLADIDMNTVDMRPNYDDSRTEPTVLPARIPNLLLNGASGIAVGMATNIPPHNLVEVCEALVHIIDNFDTVEDITPEQLTHFIHGPDFPTGASIMGRGGILNAYATGRGRVLMRAKAHFEEIRPGREAIIVTEIPFQVNKATLLERIADLVRSKRVETISDLRDETDRTGIRIVIELKRGADAGITLNQLYKYSQLQQTFGINMLALVDGEPRVLPLKRMLVLYLEHRRDVTRRRTVYELERARARQHVLEGLRIALSQLDAIIETIRRSPDAAEARVNLMTGFELSEIQAQAILDMQLRRLAALEREKIEEEYRAVTERIEYLDALLADEGKILAVIREDIEDIKTRYGDARRTSIDHDVSELLDEDLVAEENVLITVSQRGYIKRVLASTYRAQHRGGRGIIGAKTRADDLVRDNFVAGTRDTLLLFTDRGRVFQLRAYQVPETSREATGTPVANLIQIDAGERVTVVLAVPPGHFETGDYLVMVTVGGRIKRTDLKEYASVRPSGLIAINLDAGDALGWAKITTGENEIILATRRGKALRFHEGDARPMGRAAAGVNAIRLRKGDSVAAMDIVDPEADLLVVTRRGYGKRTPMSEYNLQGRFGQGVLTIDARRLGEIGEVVDARVVRDGQDIALITANGIVMRTGTEKISRMSRATRGVIVMRPGEGDEVVSLAHMTEREPVEAEEGDEDAVGSESLDAGDVIGAGDAQDGVEIVDAEDVQDGVEIIDGAAASAPDAEPEVEATAPPDADEG